MLVNAFSAASLPYFFFKHIKAEEAYALRLKMGKIQFLA